MKIRELEFNLQFHPGKCRFLWTHGLMGSMASEDLMNWFQWDQLKDATGLIRYDARGHGNTEATFHAEDYIWLNLSQDVMAILDSLKIEQAVLGGRSMGCAISIYAALSKPNRVKALVLANPPAVWELRVTQTSMFKRLANAVERMDLQKLIQLQKTNPQQSLPAWLVNGEKEKVLAYIDSLWSTDKRGLPYIFQGAALCDLPPKHLLKEISIPTLILAWQGDRSHPVESAMAIHSLLSHSTLKIADNKQDLLLWPGIIREFVMRHS